MTTTLTRPNQYPTYCHSCRKKVPENHGNLYTDSTGRYAVDCGNKAAAPAPTFTPSTYQAAINTALTTTSNHLAVGAVAGSGKTTTSAWLLAELQALLGKVLVLAFNKAIAEMFRTKVPSSVRVMTLNSFGAAQLRTNLRGRPQDPDDNKMRRLAVEMFPVENHPNQEAHRLLQAPLVALAKLERATLAGNPQKLADRYGIELGDADLGLLWEAVPLLVARARAVALDAGYIDFDDQVLLPATEAGWTVEQFDTIVVDEAQDLNEAQTRLLLRAAGSKGRVVAVGDRYQAIYGFRGAGITAFDDLLSSLRSTSRGAVELPLSVCYRCPKAAARIVNEEGLLVDEAGKQTVFLVRDDAPEGVVDHVSEKKLAETLIAEVKTLAKSGKAPPNGSMAVICPRNGPLVKPCLRLLVEGIPATIRGRDIGAEIVRLIMRVNPGSHGGGKGRGDRRNVGQEDVSVLLKALSSHCNKECEKLMKAEKEAAAEKIRDQQMVVEAFAEEAEKVSAIVLAIENIFSDETDGVVFSSVHRFKGQEVLHLYLMEEWFMPWPNAKQSWERRQGLNLRYVALTRWQEHLTYVYDSRHAPPDQDDSVEDEYYDDRSAYEARIEAEAQAREDGRAEAKGRSACGDSDHYCSLGQGGDVLPAWVGGDAHVDADPEMGQLDEVDAAIAVQETEMLSTILGRLPIWPAEGDGTYTAPTLKDWQEVKDAYAKAGCTTSLGPPQGWKQYALVVTLPGVTVQVSTTYDPRGSAARAKGANAIDITVVDAKGYVIGGRRKVLRLAGWKGRVAERVNDLLREHAKVGGGK